MTPCHSAAFPLEFGWVAGHRIVISNHARHGNQRHRADTGYLSTQGHSAWHQPPPIWRRLLVPADLTLAQLHNVLQTAMG